ncbi:MAG: heat-inducible transcriptional repressor HrcA, partial [Clostridiales bacterium]
MDDRKKQVLSAIINDYITTAEPVGSRAVAKKYGLGVSPATIRNEMSDLEELGYIEQPHTSAGRKPSDKGYRYYVDCLMEKEKLSDEEMSSIHEDIAFHLNEMDTFMQQCCQMLSRLTNYASMIVLPAPSQGCLERIQLLSINELQILALIISTTGAVRHKLIYLSHPLGREQIDYLQKLLQ